jgi:photosystem II stability/assembly factor-like uncharacterized protein
MAMDFARTRSARPALVASVMAIGMVFAFAPTSSGQRQDWQSIGPSGGDVISLAASASNVLYLGTPDGHIFGSEDAGQHWSLRGRVSSRPDAVVQKLLVNTQHENELLAAVWFQDVREGGGLYRSSDAGATWTLAGLSGEVVRAVAQSSSAPEVFVAGTRSGVFRSTDAAQSWQRVSPAGDSELRNVDSVAIDPRDPEIIYAGTYHLPWKTSDAGKNWIAVASGMIDDSDVMSLHVDSTSPLRIFASACSGIYRSENGATAWTKLQGIPYSSRRTQAIVQDPADPRTLYAATTEGLWLTHDGGESWARTTPRDWVVNDVVVIPAAPGSAEKLPNQILLGTEEQGVVVSLDGGTSFAPYNNGFSHRITGDLLSDPRDPQRLLAWMPGSRDPLMESHDGGAHWQPLPSQVKPAEISRVFASDSGWWAAGPNGILSNHDATSHRWIPFRFAVAAIRVPHRAPAAASPSGAASRRTIAPSPSALRRTPARQTPLGQTPVALPSAASDISSVRTIGARVFVATSQALWSGTLGERILRPVVENQRSEAGPTPEGLLLWLVAGGKLWQSEDNGKSWHAESISVTPDVNETELRPAAPPAVRWMLELPLPQPPAAPTATTLKSTSAASLILAGTTAGLYRQTGHGTWHLVQNGLPASEPVSYFFGDQLWLIATRAGGLYISRDAAQTWKRLDNGSIAGQFTGAAVTPDGHIVAASLTEGLLRH